MQRYENGSLPLLQRDDKNVTDSNRIGEIKSSTTQPNAHHPSHSNYYSDGSDVMNRLAYYYKYFQRRKPDSFYFGNSPLSAANYNKNTHCNNNNCAYNDYTNNKNLKSTANIAYNVRPPYSASYESGNQYDAFVNYMNETYFKPWIDSTFTQAKSTTLPNTKKKPT